MSLLIGSEERAPLNQNQVENGQNHFNQYFNVS